MTEKSAPPLPALLAEGARLLEAGDVESAATVLQRSAAACSLPGPLPSPEAVRSMQEQLARCQVAENQLRRMVLARLGEIAASCRAANYRSVTYR